MIGDGICFAQGFQVCVATGNWMAHIFLDLWIYFVSLDLPPGTPVVLREDA